MTDVSAIDALHKLTERYQLISNGGALIDVNVEEDPLYTVAGANRAY